MLSLPKHPAVRRIFRYARFFDYAQNDTENLYITEYFNWVWVSHPIKPPSRQSCEIAA